MKITKTKLAAPTRRLSKKYKMDASEKLQHILGEEIRREMDMEIMHEIAKAKMAGKDWHCVALNNTDWQDVSPDWVKENIHHPHKCFGYYWYFEDESEATMFALKWA